MSEIQPRVPPPFPWTMVRFLSPDRETTLTYIVGPDDDAIAARSVERWTLTDEWEVDVCVCGGRFRVDNPDDHAARHADPPHHPVSDPVMSLRGTMPPCQNTSRAGERA